MNKHCSICGGEGYITLSNEEGHNRDYKRPCVCTLRYLYRKSLGSEIYNAAKLKGSPLEDKVDKNMFITANRPNVLPHLRHVLISQGTNFFHRVTNDSQFLDAWLNKDKEASKEAGSTSVVYTSLRDLVEDPELLIVFLGVVSYPNRALPGVLLEGVRIRMFEGKPTWLISSHKRPFREGHYCWSPESEEYFLENFDTFEIAPSKVEGSLYKSHIRSKPRTSDESAEKSLEEMTRDALK